MQRIDEAGVLLKAAVSDVPEVARQKVAVCVGQRGSLEMLLGLKTGSRRAQSIQDLAQIRTGTSVSGNSAPQWSFRTVAN